MLASTLSKSNNAGANSFPKAVSQRSAAALPVPSMVEYKEQPINIGATEGVIASWVDSPCDFHLQLDRNRKVIEDLVLSIRSVCGAGMLSWSQEGFTQGAPCLAQFGADHCWYRGRILGMKAGVVGVRYIDYGNVELVHPEKVCT